MNEILATIKANKLRTALTAFGVFWGIFMIVLMMGISNGLESGINKQFSGMASNSFFLWASKTTMPYQGMKPGRSLQLRNSDIAYIQETVSQLAHVVPINQLGGFRGNNQVVAGKKSGNFSVIGSTPPVQLIDNVEMLAGRFINNDDGGERRKVTTIGKGVAQVLSLGENPIGKTLVINGVYFTIVGLFKSTKSDDRASDEENQLYIPLETYQRAFDFGEAVGWIAAVVKPGYSANEAMHQVKASLSSRLHFHPDDTQAIGGWNGEEEVAKMNGLFTGIKVFNWIVGLFTLIAGIVGISNIMLIVVKERTKELGVRKALGATPAIIVRMILLETVLLTVVSGYFGIVLGVLTIENFQPAIAFVSRMLHLEFGLDLFQQTGIELRTALTALGILVFFGTLAGLIPASQAVKINPIEALRDE